MTFLNPLILVGLAAAAIPVLLHLLHLRKLRTVDFSTLRFLEELQKSALRRLRIRQWLLLALRTMVILALVLAFARPALRGTSVAPLGRAQSTLVLVLDDSPSMGLRSDRGTLFAQAKAAATDVLALAEEDDVVYLLPLSSLQPGGPVPVPFGSPSSALSSLQRLELSEASTPIADALPAAAGVLQVSTHPNRELYLFTDNQATQWERPAAAGADTLGSLLSGVRIFTMDFPGPEPENAAVSDVRVTSRILTERRPVKIEATVRNFGSRPLHNGVVSAYLEGRRVAQQTVSVAPNSSVLVPLTLVPQRRGFLAGTVEMDADAFPTDNASSFALRIPDRIVVLVVSQDESTSRFLLAALTLGGDSLAAGRFAVSSVSPDRLATADLPACDVVILAGLSGAGRTDVARLSEFVFSGQGLIIFPAPDIDTAAVNGTLFRQLGLPSASLTAEMAASAEGTAFLSLRNVDLDHPLFAGMFEERIPGKRPTVESPHLTRAFGPRDAGSGHAIATLSDGTVFLAEYTPGSGRILQFAVDAGGRWSDFPLRGLFAPLVNRSVLYASIPDQDLPRAVAGEPLRFRIRLPDLRADHVFTLHRPDGRIERLLPSTTGTPGVVRFTAAPAPAGVSTVMRASTGHEEIVTPVSMISVEPSFRESDLGHADPAARAAFWAACGIDTLQTRRLTPGGPLQTEVFESRFGLELWHVLLVAAFVLALVESAVARERGKTEEAVA